MVTEQTTHEERARIKERTTTVRALGQVVMSVTQRCLQLVPGATGVRATLMRDPEDGARGLHVCVATAATPEEVVAAEDELHRALFSAVSPSKLARLSIGYTFQRASEPSCRRGPRMKSELRGDPATA